ncbi:MAG TPA: septum formation initiator family protein [Gemmatimonadales bacterium]
MALLVVLGAIYFAVQGGEYGTLDLLQLRRKERAESLQVRTLAREVDSLTGLRKRIETDPALQERYARELYGMLRAGESEFTIIR